MNTNKSKRIARFTAATVAAAGILGGALGFAAGANASIAASTASPAQTSQERASEYRDTHQPGGTGQRPGTPARPAQQPKRRSTGEPPAQGHPARNA